MQGNITVLAGDGIGPEVTGAAVKVLEKIADRFGHTFTFVPARIGGCAIDADGMPLPEETIASCRAADAVLLGAVGGPKWDAMPGHLRPEKGLLQIRQALGLFANLRPAKVFDALKEASALKPEVLGDNLDLMVVRELTGGIYFGERGRKDDAAFDTMSYAADEVRRIAHVAFRVAGKRGGKVTQVDKANVLETSRMWREITEEVAAGYPGVELEHMYVDNAAMQLIRDPRQFDVILTANLFGDILSDEASMLTGSIGLLPSASLAEGKFGMYEPVHGSAPQIAGKDLANPIGAILSAAMMLRYTFDLEAEAQVIEDAVRTMLEEGYRTADLTTGADAIGLEEATRQILSRI